jgi:CHAT domain-containing protein
MSLSKLLSAAEEEFLNVAPEPVGFLEVQNSLKPREGLWLQTVLDKKTYLFLITRDSLEFVEVAVSGAELNYSVANLKDSLDLAGKRRPSPFDFEGALDLYDKMFAPFDETLSSLESVFLVPDLSFQQINLAVLVKSVFDHENLQSEANYRGSIFLGHTHALSTIPSPKHLVLRRRAGFSSSHGDGFIGFGDPAVEGQSESSTQGGKIEAFDPISGVADPDALRRSFTPLAATASQLKKMAEVHGTAKSQVFLSEQADEELLKSLDLLNTEVLVFSTHAVVANEIPGLPEPALLLSPPAEATDLNDGLLTSSEISRLNLNARIVILSACNTGSPSGRPGAPGLSGLASSFFTAGAEIVVTSHWTIFLLSSYYVIPEFYEASKAPQSSTSEAMRLAMLQTYKNTVAPEFSHPAIWAAFSVVGVDA